LTIDIHDSPDRTNPVTRLNLTLPALAEESSKLGIDVNVDILIRNATNSVKESSKTKVIMVQTVNLSQNLRRADKWNSCENDPDPLGNNPTTNQR
jgi:hypothetical protein